MLRHVPVAVLVCAAGGLLVASPATRADLVISLVEAAPNVSAPRLGMELITPMNIRYAPLSPGIQSRAIRGLILTDWANPMPLTSTFVPVFITSPFTTSLRLQFNDAGPFFHCTGPGTLSIRLDQASDSGGLRLFDTELLSMNISGGNIPAGTMIRESPTLQSSGRASSQTLGGDRYAIDSFFDIFTELSIDGGQNWTPSQGAPTRITLMPTPGSASLLAAAALLASRRRRR